MLTGPSFFQFVFFMMPEVSGYPLERIKELFEKKRWYLIGCTQNRPLRIKDQVALGDDVPQLGREVTVEDGAMRASQEGKEADAKKEESEEEGIMHQQPQRGVVTKTTDA